MGNRESKPGARGSRSICLVMTLGRAEEKEKEKQQQDPQGWGSANVLP